MMRDIAEKSVGWLVLGGIVLAVLVAKRRYEGKFAAAVAAADANARAEVRNELGVGQNVNVAVDASHNRGATAHRCDDLFTCEVCAPIALRVLMAADRGRPGVERPSPRLASGIDHDHDYDYDYAATDDGSLVRSSRRRFRDDGGSGSSVGGAGRDGADPVGVEVAPCASVKPSSPLSDLLARPWAYDESDPRCEVKRA